MISFDSHTRITGKKHKDSPQHTTSCSICSLLINSYPHCTLAITGSTLHIPHNPLHLRQSVTTMSKILTVWGATGNQGGSLIRAVLADPVLSKEFKVRGVTRDVNKPAAKELAAQGVEMVSVSLARPSQTTSTSNGCVSNGSVLTRLDCCHRPT